MSLRISSIHVIYELRIFCGGQHAILVVTCYTYSWTYAFIIQKTVREEAFPLEALSVRLGPAQCVNSW